MKIDTSLGQRTPPAMMCYQEWDSALRDSCGHYYSTPSKRLEPDNAFRVGRFCGMDVASIRCSIDRISRTMRGIRRDDAEHFFLLHQVSGATDVVHNGIETTMETGDFLILDSVRPAELIFDGCSSDFRSVHMPRSLFLAGRERLPDAGRVLKRQHPLHSSLSNLIFGDIEESEEDVYDLFFDYVAMAFSPEPRSGLDGMRSRPGRLRLIREAIDMNLADASLKVDGLAAMVGLSKRQLQRELSEAGTSFSRMLQERRLKRVIAARRQADRLEKRVPLSDLAFSAGFSDQSHFNRVFRKHYRMAPRDYFQQPQYLAP